MKTWKTKKGTELPIISLKGKDYLEVKWRLVWFREDHADWSIETSLLRADEKSALAQAVIKNEQGRIMAMAHKSETLADFRDFTEKCETSAIGRALALIGYGTQFCADELDEGSRLADAPVTRPNPFAAKNHQPAADDGGGPVNREWKFTFGTWNKKSIHEIYHDPKLGPDALLKYLETLDGHLETGKHADKHDLFKAAQEEIAAYLFSTDFDEVIKKVEAWKENREPS